METKTKTFEEKIKEYCELIKKFNKYGFSLSWEEDDAIHISDNVAKLAIEFFQSYPQNKQLPKIMPCNDKDVDDKNFLLMRWETTNKKIILAYIKDNNFIDICFINLKESACTEESFYISEDNKERDFKKIYKYLPKTEEKTNE